MIEDGETPQRIARLTPLRDVLARIDAHVKPVEVRTVELAGAAGRILAHDIVVDRPIPHAALALRDGWAVPSDLTADAGPYAPAPVPAAVRIDVGELLPSGADAVAPLDSVIVREGQAQAVAPVAPGDGVLLAGADAAGGAVLIPAGRRLSALRSTLLAALGVERVAIRAPRLLVVRARARGERTIEAAVACIGDAVAREGGTAAVGDADEAVHRALTQADAEAVIVVGGTGCGRKDSAVSSAAAVGEVVAHGIGLIPAETAAFAKVGARPVLLLPGRLDGALAAWHMLGRPLLARLAASTDPPALRAATLARKISSVAGLAELVAVRCEGRFATPIASGYVPLTALAQADGWIFIPPESEGFQADSEVMIRPWP
jgi:molybdopterin biosynthesis enzyme